MKARNETVSATGEQSIEELQKRYQQLNTKRIRAGSDLESRQRRFDRLQREARESMEPTTWPNYAAKLSEMTAENEEKRREYQADLNQIESDLAEVERKFDASQDPSAAEGEARNARCGCLRQLIPRRATPRSTRIRSPFAARRQADRLIDRREERVRKSGQLAKSFEQINAYLAIAGKVTDALEQLNEQLFKQLLGIVQEKLTIALQEILDQPIAFRAKAGLQTRRGNRRVLDRARRQRGRRSSRPRRFGRECP